MNEKPEPTTRQLQTAGGILAVLFFVLAMAAVKQIDTDKHAAAVAFGSIAYCIFIGCIWSTMMKLTSRVVVRASSNHPADHGPSDIA